MKPFVFKRFSVQHEASTMKVGTDAVLLGAWMPLPAFSVESSLNVLEVGCGCGVISLMLAQRLQQASWPESAVRIKAVDIHEPSCAEAARNIADSPWNGMISVQNADFLQLPEPEGSFTHIISNPPFFVESLKSPEAARNMARHNDTLPFEALMCQAARLLRPQGVLALIVPPCSFACLTDESGLKMEKITKVYTKQGKACERILCIWRKSTQAALQPVEDTLFIHNDKGEYSKEYCRLVRDFYLWA